jgi:hypothetical protein
MTMMTTETNAPAVSAHVHFGNATDAEYDAYLLRIQQRFDERTSVGAGPLFTTDADADGTLFEAYLDGFSSERKQYHTCSSCRFFVRSFGSLVVIDEAGNAQSACLDEEDAPEEYKEPIRRVLKRVRRAKVTGVFLPSHTELGHAETGIWKHMAVRLPNAFKHGYLTANQAMAEKREDHNTVARALADFSAEHLTTAITLLKSDSLYRSEKVLGQAEWLGKLHAARKAAHKGQRDNVLWRAVATAPAGFCHPKASMIGTLLEDIAAGMSFEVVSARFKAKMSPLQYQRPQAAPTAGAIAQAEKLFATMGLEPSVRRRFARIEDLVTVWKPIDKQPTKPASGIFSHLTPKEALPASNPMRMPVATMTWEKFARTILPTAESIEFQAPVSGNYSAFVTAEDAEAPPILQWDSPEYRNPVSWYMYVQGSPAVQWGVTPGAYTKVTAISLKPSMWRGDGLFKHHGTGVMFVLAGAKDSRHDGLALFPEILRSELHAVRSVLESFSRSGKLSGAEEASACGFMLQGGQQWPAATIRVTSGSQTTECRLDRWD